MTRLHVTLVLPGFPAERAEPGLAAVVDTIERLAAVHDVTIVALRHPPRRETYDLAGARVEPLGFGRAGGLGGRARVLMGGVSAVLRVHRRRPIDLLHAMWADEPGAVAAAAARIVRRPLIVSAMGGELVALRDIGYGAGLGRGGRWTVAAALSTAGIVTAGSGYLRDQILQRRRQTPVRLAPLGIDTSLFSPAPRPPAKPSILFVGSLEGVKDPALMVRTFAKVANDRPDLRLVIAGDGALRSVVEDQARDLHVQTRVDLRGQVARAEMPALYRSASLLCVTSRHEGQSLAAVEAAASGLPVVGTRVGVLPDLEDGALTVAMGDELGLAESVGRVLDDRVVAARMATAGRSVAAGRYAMDRTAGNLLEMYDELVTRRKGQRRH